MTDYVSDLHGVAWATVWTLGARIGGALLLATVIALVLTMIHDRVARWLKDPGTDRHPAARIAASIVARTPRISLVVASVAIAVAAFRLFQGWMSPVLVMMLTIQAGLWLSSFASALMRHYGVSRNADHKSFANAQSLIRVVIDTAIWSIVFVLVLGNFGVDVTAMIAGLGIGGIAIGLAAQGIFADLFGSLAIVFDKPFVQGDFIVFGGESGTIENVGIKSTRIRALSGEQIVLSNASLLGATIHNYQRLRERRIVFAFGVTYQTHHSQVRQLSDVVRRVIEQTPGTRFDRAHFKNFGDSALEFEVVYYVRSPDYAKYMDIQQAINLEIMRRFEELKIEFAYPTQTVFFGNAPERERGRRAA
jgi:small-conductance mechanosensitive channel